MRAHWITFAAVLALAPWQQAAAQTPPDQEKEFKAAIRAFLPGMDDRQEDPDYREKLFKRRLDPRWFPMVPEWICQYIERDTVPECLESLKTLQSLMAENVWHAFLECQILSNHVFLLPVAACIQDPTARTAVLQAPSGAQSGGRFDLIKVQNQIIERDAIAQILADASNCIDAQQLIDPQGESVQIGVFSVPAKTKIMINGKYLKTPDKDYGETIAITPANVMMTKGAVVEISLARDGFESLTETITVVDPTNINLKMTKTK